MTAASTRRRIESNAATTYTTASASSSAPVVRTSPAPVAETYPVGTRPTLLRDPFGQDLAAHCFGTNQPLPLIPETILRRHHCFVPTDTRFRSAARLLQNAWRVDQGLSLGSYRDGAGRRHKLGSRLTATDGRRGANFISPAIARLVEKELIYREIGAVIEEERLRQNLLSSQPLCFNLFGPLKLDLGLATAVFEQLLPGFFREVVDIRFEHSPARGHRLFVGDGTAFDILVRGYTPAGKRAFVSIEIKFTEGCNEPLPRFSGCYEEIAQTSGLFVNPDDLALRANPVQQLFRQTCLGAAMLRNELYDEGVHLLIAPQHNHLAWNAADHFRHHLADPDNGRLPFRTAALEAVVGAIAATGDSQIAELLHRRYCDCSPIEQMVISEESGNLAKVAVSFEAKDHSAKGAEIKASAMSDSEK